MRFHFTAGRRSLCCAHTKTNRLPAFSVYQSDFINTALLLTKIVAQSVLHMTKSIKLTVSEMMLSFSVTVPFVPSEFGKQSLNYVS